MSSSESLPNDNPWSRKWKEIYSDPDSLVEIKFSNVTDGVKYVWVEPAAYSLELEPNTEYKIVTHERHFSIEYTSDSQFTLWMDYSFGFKLYKKEDKNVAESWILDIDMSDIN